MWLPVLFPEGPSANWRFQPLHSVIQRAATGLAQALFNQLLWALSRRVEIWVLAGLRRVKSVSDNVRVRAQDIMDLLNQPRRLRIELERYDDAAIEQSRGVVNYSRCTDKTNVGGRSLAAGGFLYPDGAFAVVTPKVRGGKMRQVFFVFSSAVSDWCI